MAAFVGYLDDRELLRKLDRMRKSHVKAAIRKGTRPGAKVVQQALKDALPKVSGQMRRKTRVRALNRSRRHVGHSCVIDIFYAGFFVRGTKRQRPNAEIQEVLDRTKQPAIDVTLQVIKQEIEARAK